MASDQESGAPIVGRFVEHEARAAVLAELHARPFLPITLPQRVYHFAFATNEEEARADRAALADLCRAHMLVPRPDDAKFQRLSIGDWRLRWEQHTEFTTYTWSTEKDAGDPFTHPDPIGTGEIAFRPPGRLIVAAHLSAIESGHSHEPFVNLFNSQSLCVIRAAKGAAHVMTDFAPDAFGFTRLLVKANAVGALEIGRLIQRVLEIETYRTMALLGLPEAREAGPELRAMEREISDITQALSRTQDMRTSRDLLKRLSDLLAQSEALSTRTAFRFGASRAYHAIVKNRLNLIQEAKESQYTTISAFFSARLDPAIETCNAFETRQARLARQVERATDLMRTGITFEMEQQNRDLLDDMNRRARLQMRLQKLVGGLSIAALSYYVAGLSLYFFKGVKDAGYLPFGFTGEEAAAAAMPFVIFGAWAFWQRVKRLSAKAQEEEKVS
ncbi:DUF3422 domain-containing protein [Methylosinus sporium]|uniref:DUF3422 domain-containing protein n=1 Tax=Methylosinus sporium TaxID=428 RepID=A0A549SZF0_METSR|nr:MULTISPECIES: DUF3422 domain-containing protein [Methylosinus]MBU3888876.1 DUF3422 domain-containing protein [Methylosinus sp. KRF6]TRL35003.1 DUF3422 domain-containing protein [Methylosinus sporium]